MGAFWGRRARRILPLALIVIGAVIAVLLPWAYGPAKVAAVRLDALFAALFAGNSRFAASSDSYSTKARRPLRSSTSGPWVSRSSSTWRGRRSSSSPSFIDTTHCYCVDGRRPIFTAATGTVLKGDYRHVSAQYAEQLASDLRHMLSESGVLPD